MSDFIQHINKEWTLFLDRDGVLNQEIDGDYVRTPEQLIIYPYAAKSVAALNEYFGQIIIVTNQRCIGRGIVSEQQLTEIHQKMLTEFSKEQAVIKHIFYAPDVADDAVMRKPQIGMALAAQQLYPNIDFSKSLMVGNSNSDIEFGINAGMRTCFVCTTKKVGAAKPDLVLQDLSELVRLIKQHQ